MAGSPWMLVRIYLMSDAESQMLIGAILDGMAGLNVHLRGGDPNHYLVVECSTEVQTHSVERFVMSIDPAASMIHASSSVADAFVA